MVWPTLNNIFNGVQEENISKMEESRKGSLDLSFDGRLLYP